jgi:type II secretory pathway component PulF
MSGFQLLLTISAIAGVLMVVLALAIGAMIALGFVAGLPLLLIFMLVYGWMFCAFLYYRRSRQDELMHLLSTAAESQVPLAPALWAYLHDRPQGTLREFWVALLLFFVLPGYYWLWHRQRCFDQKVVRVAYALEMGETLPAALRAAPGVVSPEMALAVQVGQHTGKMAVCLRSSLPPSLAPVWIELAPRFVYPLLLLLFLSGILGIWMNFIFPKLERIFYDFDAPMPEMTRRVSEFYYMSDIMSDKYFVGVPMAVLILQVVIGAAFASSTFRWYFPILGRIYRRYVQSYVLKMLATFLETGTPVPQALGLLADTGAFAAVAERRLLAVRQRIEQGQPLAESLHWGGLLPAAAVPLIQAAERVNNLPWALTELGDVLANRTIRNLRRLSQIVSPTIVLLIGFLIGYIVKAMFIPMVELLTRFAN